MNFHKTDLQYYIDYDYRRSSCHCDEDICRCTTIEEAWVNDIDVNKVIQRLYSIHRTADGDIDAYCFDRICRAFKIYDKDLYDIDTGFGYYGEEVHGVWFENEEKIFDAYREMLSFEKTIDKVRYCLNLEYGYLLDCIKSASLAHIVKVSPERIQPPQQEYYKRVDQNVIESYRNIELPIAVCFRTESGIRLIDGYHRFVANKERPSVEIILVE